MTLTIDVSERNFITIIMRNARGERKIRRPGRTEKIVLLIDAALKKWRLAPNKISRFSIKTGESSSAARAAVSIANALSLAYVGIH
ncbi:MAG: hypothetical protein HW383_762 [Candidatus Magasanikbacteria bacterium]|nr:hypothetical protein [Candidatus Magasanikbacteria bacterium]